MSMKICFYTGYINFKKTLLGSGKTFFKNVITISQISIQNK